MNTDQDLREHFAHQRHSDHEYAPAWNPRHLEVTAKRVAWRLPFWLPITAAASLLLSIVWLRDAAPADDLTAMPELFTTQGEPLFASLTPATPSDSFLPIHLTIQLP